MQPRRVRGVGMAQLDDFQRFSLEMEVISVENLRRCQLRRKLSGKARFPEGLYKVGPDLVLNGRNHGCRRDRSGIGESIEQDLQTEVVVTMSMGDVYAHEIPAAHDAPILQFPRLLIGQNRV